MKKKLKDLVHLTVFETEEDLMLLTGVKHRNDLWDAGFDLDDWDIGFCSDKPLHRAPDKEEQEEYGYGKDKMIWDFDTPAYWLMERMENYCVGPSYTEYNGKHYYMVHHA